MSYENGFSVAGVWRFARLDLENSRVLFRMAAVTVFGGVYGDATVVETDADSVQVPVYGRDSLLIVRMYEVIDVEDDGFSARMIIVHVARRRAACICFEQA